MSSHNVERFLPTSVLVDVSWTQEGGARVPPLQNPVGVQTRQREPLNSVWWDEESPGTAASFVPLGPRGVCSDWDGVIFGPLRTISQTERETGLNVTTPDSVPDTGRRSLRQEIVFLGHWDDDGGFESVWVLLHCCHARLWTGPSCDSPNLFLKIFFITLQPTNNWNTS